MKGVYTLLIELGEPAEINTIRRTFTLEQGYYTYVGSAMNNVQARIERHLSRNKNRHWHIDFLLDKSRVKGVSWAQTASKVECQLAQQFAPLGNVRDFGCSDCNCPSHLFFSNSESSLNEKITAAYKACGLTQRLMLI